LAGLYSLAIPLEVRDTALEIPDMIAKQNINREFSARAAEEAVRDNTSSGRHLLMR
jgi:hypothetical protein